MTHDIFDEFQQNMLVPSGNNLEKGLSRTTYFLNFFWKKNIFGYCDFVTIITIITIHCNYCNYIVI